MKLILGWRDSLNRLWSVRIALFTAVLAAADPIVALFERQVPPFVYSMLCAGIIVARVLQQSDPEKTITGK